MAKSHTNLVQSDKAARGTKIVTSFGRDDSSMALEYGEGCKMGGSTTNIAHSITGASAKQGGNATRDYTKKL